ncbi:hypothetical protein [Promicromonospora soli]|uniref:Uncharacterized protein n=1 Tax=Promicromonospora soli TaxID=2035533 RepID=A0A919KZY3_9MICO|nr:hypothetical protein [Promicromonospora soli]GHH78867.1 hypothetical protein GCM10017772_43200 [Promicromonospora soli]
MTVVPVSSEAGTDFDTGAPDVEDSAVVADTRHARALAALRSAEVRTGVRKQATAARAIQVVRTEQPREHLPEQPAEPAFEPLAELSVESPAGSPRELSREPRVQVRALRGGLATRPGTESATRSAPSSGGLVGAPGEDARILPVHPHLAALLPDGGLRTGTTVVVRGSTSLLLTLLAEASRDGAWTVLAGYPAAGMAAAADAGCDLARTLVVPLPSGSGVDAPPVLAALIDGMDVVVIGPEVTLLDHDRRRLTARARERGSVLVAAGPPNDGAGRAGLGSAGAGSAGAGWPGAHVVLEATAGAWAGIDHGAGWLRRRTLRVRRTGRGSAARPLHLDVEVPVCRAAAGAADLVGGVELVRGTELVGGVELAAEQSSVVGEAGTTGGASESRPQLELVG